MPMPWRIAAGRIASPGSTSNVLPLGCTITLNVMFRYPRAVARSFSRSILPSIQSPLGALPSRFRRQRVLIVGCGDVGLRLAARLRGRVTLRALTSSPARIAELRGAGIVPIHGNLHGAASLRQLAALAT